MSQMTPEILKKAMRESGLTMTELARHLEISQQSLSDMINGRARVAPLRAQQIQRVLGLNADMTEISLQSQQSAPPCPFMNSRAVRLALSIKAFVRRIVEAVIVGVLVRLLTSA
ncbi:helix-turn-helix domain-containing protein [Pseudomonas sp. GD03842]|uniref:helix-turn-helix domain-containing protein n=1 Tax=Pseudomonas sp. GD03842 TaxID=2975385 RepID=UPI0024476F6B|nr:helix-turn-helix transcriptional regulator [Pseudomonas sp. GD03842]MDH0745239.1 helix-turn-helix domain-containing protein [Pseudomonas sp. GD03842]